MCNKKKERINVVVASDDKFAIHVNTCISSVVDNLEKNEKVEFYLLDGGISREKWKKIKKLENKQEKNRFSVKKVETRKKSVSNFQVPRDLSNTAYLRLLIPNALPDDVARVIYLDADLIVEKNIKNLWNISLQNNSTGAVKDFAIPKVGSRGGVKYARELGINPEAPYLNSGVLLIDVQKWRQKSIGSQALDYLETYGEEVRQADQEALNIVLADDWLPLDRRWNVPPTMLNLDYWEYLERKGEVDGKDTSVPVPPAVIHFTGVRKPWMFGTDIVWQDRYFHYLRKSGWFDGEAKWLWWRIKSALRYGSKKSKHTKKKVLKKIRKVLK